MSWKKRVEPYSKHQYAVYEVAGEQGKFIGGFDSVTGGDLTIATVSYKVMDANGHVFTRSMPGQTSYSPISLLRPVDKGSKKIYAKFADASTGKLKDVRRDYSVSMNNDAGKPVVWWDLLNALPVKISGFSFNEYAEKYYTDFTIDLQAEEIIITFIEGSSN